MGERTLTTLAQLDSDRRKAEQMAHLLGSREAAEFMEAIDRLHFAAVYGNAFDPQQHGDELRTHILNSPVAHAIYTLGRSEEAARDD